MTDARDCTDESPLAAAPASGVEDWQAGVQFNTEECSVCMEVMGGACPVRKLACGHQFHHACIQRWLERNASCPLCKAETPCETSPVQRRGRFKVDLGHQEMAQILTELEDIFRAVHACAGAERPVAIHGLAYNLCASLGYEDEDELEEAIGGTLADFLDALPHFTVVWPDLPASQHGPEVTETPAAVAAPEEAGPPSTPAEAPADGAPGTAAQHDAEVEVAAADLQSLLVPRATMLPEPLVDELTGPGRKITFTVAEREDLWRVVLQGPCADIEIPEIEFGIRPRETRRVDTIYNIIASAVFHLGDHVQKNRRANAISDEEVSKIVATIDSLNVLLDIEQSWTFVVSDPQGISELKPQIGAHVCPLRDTGTSET